VAKRARQMLRQPQQTSGPRTWRWAAAILVAGSIAAGSWFAAGSGGRNGGIARTGGIPPDASTQPVVPPSAPPVQNPHLAGLVRIDGPVPQLPRPLLKMEGPNCGHHHPPPKDDSILVGPGGGVANVVVAVAVGLYDDTEFPAPTIPVVLDQKDCQYVPHVVAMQVGQDLMAKNGDPFLHSVHTNPMTNKPVNIAQTYVDRVGTRVRSIKAAETFKVTCDLHPWMVAWVAAFDHPYFAVTRDDGSFTMPLMPPGTYTLRAWHERLGAVDQQVTVAADGRVPPVQFHFTRERVAAAMSDQMPTADASGVP
jgi:hypothetical protein